MRIDVIKEDFQADVIVPSLEKPVVVLFWAEWCGPCKVLKPVLEQLAEEHDFTLARVDAGSQEELVAQYGVRGVPTMMIFDGGEAKSTKVGALNHTQLIAWLEDHGVMQEDF